MNSPDFKHVTSKKLMVKRRKRSNVVSEDSSPLVKRQPNSARVAGGRSNISTHHSLLATSTLVADR